MCLELQPWCIWLAYTPFQNSAYTHICSWSAHCFLLLLVATQNALTDPTGLLIVLLAVVVNIIPSLTVRYVHSLLSSGTMTEVSDRLTNSAKWLWRGCAKEAWSSDDHVSRESWLIGGHGQPWSGCEFVWGAAPSQRAMSKDLTLWEGSILLMELVKRVCWLKTIHCFTFCLYLDDVGLGKGCLE